MIPFIVNMPDKICQETGQGNLTKLQKTVRIIMKNNGLP